jgi:hypothetical protein
MKYDKKTHLNLLKYSQKLKQEDKKLYDESREDFFILLKYSAMMEVSLNWQNREHYVELIEKLLNGPLHFLALRQKFQAVSDAVERLEAELLLLERVEPYEKIYDFSILIDDIISLFDRYCPDPSLRESNEFSEEELRDLIQEIFLEIKEKYKEDL